MMCCVALSLWLMDAVVVVAVVVVKDIVAFAASDANLRIAKEGTP